MLPKVMKLLSERQPVKIVPYGDSISSLLPTEKYSGGASSPQMNWAGQLRVLLEQHYTGHRFVVEHFGRGGQNAYEGLGRIGWLGELGPDLVLLEFGTNDCQWHPLPPECTAHAMRTLVLGIRDLYKADVVVLGPGADNPIGGTFQHVAETCQALCEVARQTQAPFVDIRSAILLATDNGKNWTRCHHKADDCHPNDQGHAVWAAAVFDVIKQYVTVVPPGKSI